MNEEIKKFWENAGYKISDPIRIRNRNDTKWYRCMPPESVNHTTELILVARHFEINNRLKILYYLDSLGENKYSEQ